MTYYVVTGDAAAVTGQTLCTGAHAIEVSDPVLQDRTDRRCGPVRSR